MFSLRVQFGPCPLCHRKAVLGFMAYSAARCFGRLTCRPCLFFKIRFVLKAFSQKGFALKMSNTRCRYIPVVVNDRHSLHFFGLHSWRCQIGLVIVWVLGQCSHHIPSERKQPCVQKTDMKGLGSGTYLSYMYSGRAYNIWHTSLL